MKNFNFIEDTKVINEMMSYLDPFEDHEEGGILLGKRTETEDSVTVELTEFVPVKSQFSAWGIEEGSNLDVPPVGVGYFPDPLEVLPLLERVYPYNSDSEISIIGFVHNHMKYLPNPSRWDLERVSKLFGYLMPIYSNKTKELKVWYVTTKEEDPEPWELKKSLSSAQVVLEVTYVNK